MIKVFVVIALVLLLSCDGLMAQYSVHVRRTQKKAYADKQCLLSTLAEMEPIDELRTLRQRGGICFPVSVMARGGFTGRGSPFLTRNQYSPIEIVEKSIERIVRK